jgi:hypothetical protein
MAGTVIITVALLAGAVAFMFIPLAAIDAVATMKRRR